jgi:hypothetical protein
MGHDDQRSRQMRLIRAHNESRGLALGCQAGVTLLGDEGDIPWSGAINGRNTLNYQVCRTLEFSSQQGRQFTKGAFHGGS